MRKVDYQSSVDQYGEVGTLVKHLCLENTSGFDDLRVLIGARGKRWSSTGGCKS